MALGIRGGMGVEARRLLREALGLKLAVFHSCDTHDCKTHGNWAGGGGVKKRGDVGVGDEDPFGIDPKPRKKSAPREGRWMKEAQDERRAYGEKSKKYQTFDDERVPQRKLVNLDKARLTDRALVTGDALAKDTAAMELIKNDRNFHGMVILDKKSGRFIHPRGINHVGYRLQMFGLGDLVESGELARIIRDDKPFSVELKPGTMKNGEPRGKNYLYVITGRKEKAPVLLNIAYNVKTGTMATAFIENVNGRYEPPASAIGKVRELKGGSLDTVAIPVDEFIRGRRS